MADYREDDVTEKTTVGLKRMIEQRLVAAHSVEIFRNDEGRLILRTWYVAFDISDFTKDD